MLKRNSLILQPYCSPSTSDAWWWLQQDSDFGEVAFHVLMTLLDPEVRLYPMHSLLLSCVVLALLVDGGCIVLWNLQRINGTEWKLSFSSMCLSSFRTTAWCLSLFHSTAMSSPSWRKFNRKSKNCNRRIKQPAPSAYAAAPMPPPPLSALPAREGNTHPRPHHMEDEQLHTKRRHVADGRLPAIDMDGDMQVEEKKEDKEERDVQCELEHRFSHAAPFLSWYAPHSQPDVQWKAMEPKSPRLALLARRFLSIPLTSALSERVCSRFGHVISKQSSTIDSTIAAQIMFLRDNEHLLNSVDPFYPTSWYISPITTFASRYGWESDWLIVFIFIHDDITVYKTYITLTRPFMSSDIPNLPDFPGFCRPLWQSLFHSQMLSVIALTSQIYIFQTQTV